MSDQISSYCGWEKSCTSEYKVSPTTYRVLYIPGGDRRISEPSTVSPTWINKIVATIPYWSKHLPAFTEVGGAHPFLWKSQGLGGRSPSCRGGVCVTRDDEKWRPLLKRRRDMRYVSRQIIYKSKYNRIKILYTDLIDVYTHLAFSIRQGLIMLSSHLFINFSLGNIRTTTCYSPEN